jgi:hypothetical protein
VAAPLPRGAGVLTSLVRADGLLLVPSAREGYDAGAEVEVRLLRDLDAVERTIVAIGSHDPCWTSRRRCSARATRCSRSSPGRSARWAGWWRCARACATSRVATCWTPSRASTRCRGSSA